MGILEDFSMRRKAVPFMKIDSPDDFKRMLYSLNYVVFTAQNPVFPEDVLRGPFYEGHEATPDPEGNLNQQAYYDLIDELDELGVWYTPVIGAYDNVPEYSVIAWEISETEEDRDRFARKMVELSREYGQESAIVSTEDSDDAVEVYTTKEDEDPKNFYSGHEMPPTGPFVSDVPYETKRYHGEEEKVWGEDVEPGKPFPNTVPDLQWAMVYDAEIVTYDKLTKPQKEDVVKVMSRLGRPYGEK